MPPYAYLQLSLVPLVCSSVSSDESDSGSESEVLPEKQTQNKFRALSLRKRTAQIISRQIQKRQAKANGKTKGTVLKNEATTATEKDFDSVQFQKFHYSKGKSANTQSAYLATSSEEQSKNELVFKFYTLTRFLVRHLKTVCDVISELSKRRECQKTIAMYKKDNK